MQMSFLTLPLQRRWSTMVNLMVKCTNLGHRKGRFAAMLVYPPRWRLFFSFSFSFFFFQSQESESHKSLVAHVFPATRLLFPNPHFYPSWEFFTLVTYVSLATSWGREDERPWERGWSLLLQSEYVFSDPAVSLSRVRLVVIITIIGISMTERNIPPSANTRGLKQRPDGDGYKTIALISDKNGRSACALYILLHIATVIL